MDHLRGKLTSSKCLLGTSRINTGNGSIAVCRHNSLNCTCNVIEVFVQNCDVKISEVKAASPTEHQKHSTSTSPEVHRSHQNHLTQKLNVLKTVFSTAVSCFTCTLKTEDGGNHDGCEYHAITIFNRHTRESVDLSTPEIHHFSNTGYKSSVEEREAIKSKTFELLKSLFSLRLKAFWKQKPKKPFPFFQKYNEETEYMAEEIIVLANKHADESMTPSTCSKTEVKHLCPGMLTVSVDVAAFTSEITEDNKASKTPSHVSDDMKVMAGIPSEGVTGGGETHMIAQSPRDSCMTQNRAVSPDYGHSPNVDDLHKQQSTPDVIS